MQPKAALGLLKETFSEWQQDKASRLAAALAYFTIFSLAPLLLIAIAVAGFVFGAEAVRGQIVGQIEGMVGVEGAAAIETAIENAYQPGTGILSAIIGIVMLLFGASGVFGQLKDALNTIWEVEPKPGRGIMATIKERFLSMTMVLGIGFLLLVSLVVSAALATIGNLMSGLLPGAEVLWHVVNFVVSMAVITLLFAMIFKILPDARIAWRDVWIGAAATALLFTLGKLLIGLYLGHASVGDTYGAAGSVVVLLVWIFYSAQILFFGAEFTQVYARHYGSRIVPEEHAVSVTEETRAQQGIPRRDQSEAASDREQRSHQPGAAAPASRRTGAFPTLAAFAAGALVMLRLKSRQETARARQAQQDGQRTLPR